MAPSHVRVLNQHTAADRAQISCGSCIFCRRQQPNEPQIFFLLQNGARPQSQTPRNDHFAENFADHFRHRFAQRPIADNNAAERRLLVGRKRLLPRLAQVRIGTDAAGIRMLQDR